MADVRCDCGHLRGEHIEADTAAGIELWCWECKCSEFRPTDGEEGPEIGDCPKCGARGTPIQGFGSKTASCPNRDCRNLWDPSAPDTEGHDWQKIPHSGFSYQGGMGFGYECRRCGESREVEFASQLEDGPCPATPSPHEDREGEHGLDRVIDLLEHIHGSIGDAGQATYWLREAYQIVKRLRRRSPDGPGGGEVGEDGRG